MAAEKEFRVPFEEARVSIECNECGAELIVDLSKRDNWDTVTVTVNPKCGICNKPYDATAKADAKVAEHLNNILQSLVNARRISTDKKIKVSFRFRVTND
jgi:ssDNA-binding Zn-finger/Zn-ribbon topoisomerase 1